MDFTEGQTYHVPYPFSRSEYTEYDEDGAMSVPVWTPGCVQRSYDLTPSVAHGLGSRILTCLRIVSLPSPYPTRTLYTQRWQDPDGKVFGNAKLRMCSLRKFTGLLAGYRYPYTMKESL
jgi:hypothetical protein